MAKISPAADDDSPAPRAVTARVGVRESRETYLWALVETGALSLAALPILFWAVLRLIWPALETLAWVAAFAGFLACGLFVDTLHWRELWAVMGVASAVAAHRRQAAARP